MSVKHFFVFKHAQRRPIRDIIDLNLAKTVRTHYILLKSTSMH